MSPTQREMCDLHRDRLDRIESKVDALDAKFDAFMISIATREAKTKTVRALVDGFFGFIAAASAAYAVLKR